MYKNRICIIGDGLVGLSTALSLSELNLTIDLFCPKKNGKISVDGRTTSISPSNFQSLSKLIEKRHLEKFWPIRQVDLFKESENGYFRFMKFEKDNKNIMHIIENNKFKEIFFRQIKKKKNIKIKNGIVTEINKQETSITFKKRKFFYDMVLLCTGKKSELSKKFLGKRTITKDSNEISITTFVNHNKDIKDAKQYFFNEGPLAILPINPNKFSLVWSLNTKIHHLNIKNLINAKLTKIIGKQSKFKLAKIKSYPVSFKFNSNYSANNILILGEASYNVHPIAGQGFNLVLRDIEKLKDEITKFLGLGISIKNSLIIPNFLKNRKPENLIFGLGINFINNFFKYNKITDPAKRLILKSINEFKFFKRINLRISDTGIFK